MLEIIEPGRYRYRKKKRLLFPLLLILAGIFGLRAAFSAASPAKIVSPIPDSPVSPSQTQNPPVPTQAAEVKSARSVSKTADSLRENIRKLAGSDWNNYSVLVVDYTGNLRMGIGDSVIYTAASVNKIPILTALYAEVEKGETDLDQTITLQARDIQDYGTGSIRYAKPGTVYSVKTLARLMISQSDNTAAYILANHIVGIKNIQKQMDIWGLTQTDIMENKTSNADIEILFKKISTNGVAGEALTREMLSFMVETDFEDRLPALLPETATVYHKIGTEVGVIHDAGIVAVNGQKYYIGVFVGDVTDEEAAVKFIAQVSKTVYEFMTK